MRRVSILPPARPEGCSPSSHSRLLTTLTEPLPGLRSTESPPARRSRSHTGSEGTRFTHFPTCLLSAPRQHHACSSRAWALATLLVPEPRAARHTSVAVCDTDWLTGSLHLIDCQDRRSQATGREIRNFWKRPQANLPLSLEETSI